MDGWMDASFLEKKNVSISLWNINPIRQISFMAPTTTHYTKNKLGWLARFNCYDKLHPRQFNI